MSLTTVLGTGVIAPGDGQSTGSLSSQHAEMLLQPWLLLEPETAWPETSRAVRSAVKTCFP